MSRVGLNPIFLPEEVSVSIKSSSINIKGPKGEISQDFNSEFSIKEKNNQIIISRPTEQKFKCSVYKNGEIISSNII